MLFQLPRQFPMNLARLDGFLAALTRQRYVPRLRAVLEVRHASWLDEAVFTRLRAANVALCFHDSENLAVTEPVTADFVYVRRHGPGRRYRGSYPARAIRADAVANARQLLARLP